MAINNRAETAKFIDPFWLEHAQQIRALKDILQSPKTRAGEERLNNACFNTSVLFYQRLLPIIGSVIALTEFDEIGKYSEKNYFADPVNKRIALRAVKLRLEEILKSPYPEEEKKNYFDYLSFFEKTTKRLNLFDMQIQGGANPVAFVNSVALIISQETVNLRGVENFSIKVDNIRRSVRNYLPSLARLEQGKVFSEIKSQLEKSLFE